MTDRRPSLIACVLTVIAALLALRTGECRSADESDRALAPLPAPASDDAGRWVGESAGTVPEAAMSSGPAGCDVCQHDFWVVSSHRCRQSYPKCCVAGELDYFHSNGNSRLQPLDRAAFLRGLQPGVPVCIVVHGSFVEADMLLGGGLMDASAVNEDDVPMYRWIRGAAPDRPINVVFYTWPSDAPITYIPHADVAILGQRSSFNALYLADLIASLPPDHPVCLVGHSHGARMVAATLHLLAGGMVEGHRLCYTPANNARIRAVLIAGALDHQWLVPGQRYGRALCRAEALINLKNDRDLVLNIYPFRKLFSRRALGEAGVTRRDRWNLGAMNARLAEMDVTPLIGSGHQWRHYYVRPEIACALRPYFYFDDARATAADDRNDASLQQAARGPRPHSASAPAQTSPRRARSTRPERPLPQQRSPRHSSSDTIEQTSNQRS